MDTIVSAARHKPNGLHLGHYLGNFSSRKIDLKTKTMPYIFVIEDVAPYTSLMSSKYDNVSTQIIKDVLSIGNKENFDIKCVFLSDFISHNSILYSLISDFVNINHIRNIHPKRKELRQTADNINFSEFSFIVNEVFYTLALGSKYVFMNDDNLPFINYARSVARRINNSFNKKLFNEPHLVTGIYPRLKGFNGERMSKSRNNAIYFSDDKSVISEKISELFLSRKFLKYVRMDSNGYYRHKGNEIDTNFLPFQYIDIFLEKSEANFLKDDFTNGKISIDILQKQLEQKIQNFIETIENHKKENYSDKKKLIDIVELDTEYVISLIQSKTELLKRILI
jgi:tryptophanyl-tRNA synthetase